MNTCNRYLSVIQMNFTTKGETVYIEVVYVSKTGMAQFDVASLILAPGNWELKVSDDHIMARIPEGEEEVYLVEQSKTLGHSSNKVVIFIEYSMFEIKDRYGWSELILNSERDSKGQVHSFSLYYEPHVSEIYNEASSLLSGLYKANTPSSAKILRSIRDLLENVYTTTSSENHVSLRPSTATRTSVSDEDIPSPRRSIDYLDLTEGDLV